MRKRNDPAWYVPIYYGRAVFTIIIARVSRIHVRARIKLLYITHHCRYLYYIELNIVSRIYNTRTHTRRVQPRFAIIEKRFQFRIKHIYRKL